MVSVLIGQPLGGVWVCSCFWGTWDWGDDGETPVDV